MNKGQWFAESLRNYEKALLRFALSKVPKDPAQEIVQECFLRLWKERPERLQGREGPWLFAVTRNLCLDWQKSEGKRRNVPLDRARLVDPRSPALQQLLQNEHEGEIKKAIAALNEVQQEVLRLKFQDGFSYKEISQITGHSISYVGVLIHEAMTVLREKAQPRKIKVKGDIL